MPTTLCPVPWDGELNPVVRMQLHLSGTTRMIRSISGIRGTSGRQIMTSAITSRSAASFSCPRDSNWRRSSLTARHAPMTFDRASASWTVEVAIQGRATYHKTHRPTTRALTILLLQWRAQPRLTDVPWGYRQRDG